MYTEYLSSQQEAPPEPPHRQASPPHRAAPKRRPPRRDTRRRVLLAAMALVLFLGGFISGCCVGRTHGSSNTANSENGTDVSGSKQQESNIPASIILPDYIKEDLLPVNEYSRCGDKLQRVTAVVIHYVGNPNTTAWQNRSYFANLATTGETSASSNLIVGLEGEALLCVPLDEVAYCSNDRNHDTISIEFCHPDTDGKPTQATYDTLVKLTAWLCDLFGLDPQEDVIRHYDVIDKECPLYFVRNKDEWTQFKSDVANAMK